MMEYGTGDEMESMPEAVGEMGMPLVEGNPDLMGPTPIAAATEGAAPETVNLAETLTEEETKKLVDACCRDYEVDLRSSTKWRKRHARILALALGQLPEPEDGEMTKARIHLPIIMTATSRIQVRIYDQQFPSNGEFFGVRPTDALDLERSVRVAKHLNWQILHKIKEYVTNHDSLISQVLLFGSAFTMVSWDPVENRPRHEVINTEDLILPYYVRRNSTEPSLEGIPRITRLLRKYRHELEAIQDAGYYSNLDKVFEKADEEGDKTSDSSGQDQMSASSGQVQQVIDRDAGIEKQGDQSGGPRLLLEQHRWWKLPREKRQRPIVATIDYESKTLVCLKLREDEDPVDKARYNRQKKEIQAAYEMAEQQYILDLVAYQQGMQQRPMMTPPPMPGDESMTAPPMPGEETMTAPPIPGEMTPSMPMEPQPVRPQMPPPPEPPKMVPIHFFTHYVCQPNPEGIYGLGIGALLEGHNIAADVILSQVVDAATLANTVMGFRSRQAKIRGGDFHVRPGEFLEVDANGEDITKLVHVLKFPGPEPAMNTLVESQVEAGRELSGANEILSGEVGGSNETATTTQIRISQAMAQINILNKRYTRARTCEGQKIARLNSVHLEDVEYFNVVDPFKGPIADTVQVGRADYLEDVDITITADPRMASQPQRFQEAMQAMQVTMQIPALAMNMPLMAALAKNIYIAMDRPDLIQVLTNTPGPPLGMPGQAPPPPGGPPPGGEAPKEDGGPPRPDPAGPRVPGPGVQPEAAAIGA